MFSAAVQGVPNPRPARMRVVVVGGHPDDPESGCGGTIARCASLGHEVFALYLTRGETGIPGTAPEEAGRIRSAEAAEACRILGAKPVFAGQVNGSTEVNKARYDEFRTILLDLQPAVVLAHWPVDTHRDHRAASLLAYDAWLSARRAFGLYYFEVMTGSQTQNFQPTDYVDISEFEPKKRAACMAHASQKPGEFYEHHRKMQEFRGVECRARYAEAYVRHVQSPISPALPVTAR